MATYKIKGARLLRKYRAQNATFSYMALSDAEKVAANLCNLPWEEATVGEPTFPAHSGTSDELDAENVSMQDSFDAALFCAEHLNARHRAYANAACYRFTMPEDASGKLLTEIKAKVYCDPYNSHGARISVYVSDDENPPMECSACRLGSSEDDSDDAQSNNGTETEAASEWYSTNTHVEGVAPRKAKDGSWFANSGYAVIRPDGGLEMKKYLFVFVLMENYATARAGFLEGAAYADGVFELSTAEDVEGLLEGEVNDLGGKIDLGLEYSVVTDGVYPSVSDGENAAHSICLQRTGDTLKSYETSTDGPDGEKLYNLNRGELAEILDVPADSITCIAPIQICYTKNNATITVESGTIAGSFYSYMLAIGGTFDTGTFDELPGLYLYFPDRGLVLRDIPIAKAQDEEGVPDDLKDFIRKHGGLATCIGHPWVISYSSNASGTFRYSGVNLSLIAKDGTTFRPKFLSSTPDDQTICPVIVMTFVGGAVGDFIVNARVMRNNYRLENIFALTTSHDCELYCSFVSSKSAWQIDSQSTIGSVEFALMVFNRGEAKMKLYRMVVQMTCGMLLDTSNTAAPIKDFYFYPESLDSAMGPFGAAAITGVFKKGDALAEITSLAPGCGIEFAVDPSDASQGIRRAVFAIAGDFTLLNGVHCKNLALITLDSNGRYNVAPFNTENLIPDVYKGYSLQGGMSGWSMVDNVFRILPPTSMFVCGEFTQLGDERISRIARLTVAEIKASAEGDIDTDTGLLPAVSPYLIAVPEEMDAPKVLFDMRNITNGVLCAANSRSRKTLYRALHTDVSAEQSVAGLRILYGKLYSGSLTKVDSAKVLGGSAIFSVCGDVVKLPTEKDGVEVIESVPTWQLTTAKLIVPFALPTWNVNELQLDWEVLEHATPGAKLNVWIRPEFIETYPETSNPAIYDASLPDVDGWHLVGTIDATATTATLPVDVSGNVATLMFTAYINLDDFVPSADMTLPLGVGVASVDVVSGKASGLDTGWRPNITLLG